MGVALLSHHHEGVRQYTAHFLCNLAHDHSAAHPWLMQLMIKSIALADSKHHVCGDFYDVFAAVVKDMGRQTLEVKITTISAGLQYVHGAHPAYMHFCHIRVLAQKHAS